MRPIYLLLSILLLAGCATTSKPPVVAPPDQANLYGKSYVERAKPPATKPSAPPRIYRGEYLDTDYQKLLEAGYDILGYSSFEAGDVPPEQALEQAAKVNADLVMVYSRRNGRVPMSVRMDAAKTRAKSEDQGNNAPQSGRLVEPQSQSSRYEYFASYWTKLAPPILGLHVQVPGEGAKPSTGLPVLAVIKDSPAAAAEIRAGDTLLRIGDAEMRSVDALLQATLRYAGQPVEIVFARAAETLHRTVVLNAKTD